MKVVFILLIFFCVSASGQIPDTLYTKASAISRDKKSVITKTTEISGKKIQEIEVMDSVKVKSELAKLKQDTVQYNQYFRMLESQHTQLQVEKQRIRKMYREAVRQLKLYGNTLINMKS